MGPNTKNWSVGEVVNLPVRSTLLKQSGTVVYEQLVGSRYLCIREAKEGQAGILVKVLGKDPASHITIVNGKPFCKDDREERFYSTCYSSYPFPSLAKLQEVLAVIRNNPALIQQFEDASMHINPKSKFWVNDTTTQLLFLKKPLCYDASADTLGPASKTDAPYRVSLVYFYKDDLSW